MKTITTVIQPKNLLWVLSFFLCSFSISAQTPSDCCGAIGINSGVMNNPDGYMIPTFGGFGVTKEGFFSCQSICKPEAEIHSWWLSFTCVESGTFEFLIFPEILPPGLVADFNWTLFENECPCGPTTNTVACNDALPHGPANSGGNWTGIADNVDNSFGFLPTTYVPPAGPLSPFENTITLTEGNTYFLFINNTSADLISSATVYFAGAAGIVEPHNTPNLEPGPMLLGNFSPCPNGENQYYEAVPSIIGQTYNWTLFPPTQPIGNGVNEIQVSWEDIGTYELCVEVIQGCFPITEKTCKTIVVNDIPPTHEKESVCIGDPYIAGNGQAYFAPGVFNYTLLTDSGCDSTVILELEALEPSATFFEDEICQGESIIVGDEEFSESGVYIKELQNEDGCDSVVTFFLFVFPFELEVIPELDTINCREATAIFDTGTSIIDENSSFEWIDNTGTVVDTTPVFSTSIGGVYTLKVEDPNGCKDELEVIAEEDFTTPEADAGAFRTLSCKEGTTELDGTASTQSGNVTYEWSGPSIVSGANTLTPIVDDIGMYTLIVTNEISGCTESSTVEVIEDVEPPLADAGISGSLDCTITSISLDGSASDQGPQYTYEWQGPGIQSGANTLTPVVVQSGTYTIIVTNGENGCTAEATTFVGLDDTPPDVNAGPNQQLDCVTETVMLAGNSVAGATYSWAGPLILNGETTLTPEVGAPGIYTLTVATEGGCSAAAVVTVIEDLMPPTADAGPAMSLNCNADDLVLDGSNSSQGANFTYSWSGPGLVSGGNTLMPTINVLGNYELLVTNNNNGCTETSSIEVTETLPPVLSLMSQTNVDCNGNATGAASVEVMDGLAPYSYEWSSGGMDATETDLMSGDFTVTVTDGHGCTASLSVSISEPALLDFSIASTDLTKVGANDGTATANPTGGTAPYSYSWDNGDMTQTIDNLAPGEYFVTITDENDCTATQSVTIHDFDCSPVGLSFDAQNLDCNGDETGTATALIANGAAPITYNWSNGGMDATISDLNAGTYTVTITDDNGCALTDEITIDEPTALKGNILGFEDIDCNGNANGSASVDVSGGTPNYSYAWSSGGSNADVMDLQAGIHTVTITDANNCETTLQVTITEPPVLELQVDGTSETGVDKNDGSATATPSGGTVDYTYLWDNGAEDAMISDLAPGTYCVTITDANGCTTEDCFTVNEFECGVISSAFDVVDVKCNSGNDGEATVNITGGTGPFTYEWSNGNMNQTATGLAASTYEVTATDVNGCVHVEEVIVPEPVAIEVSIVEITDAACEGSATGAASVEGMGGTGNLSYEWSNGIMESFIENAVSGTYNVTVTDENDCTESIEVIIGGENDDVPPIAMVQNITVVLDDDGMASITPDMINNGSSDNCELGLLELDIVNFTCDDVGEVTVTFTANDVSGNSTTETAIVTVVDETAPLMICPDDIFSNFCLFPVNYPLPTLSDNCAIVSNELIAGLEPGSVFPLGTTEVTYMATDASGNESSCSFNVTVQSDLFAETQITEPDCTGDENGTATVEVDNGTPPYTYAWNDPNSQVTPTANNLMAGIYSVTITDATGCEIAATTEVTEPDPVTITIDEIINETDNNMDGAISITPAGGTNSSYTYEWTFNGDPYSTEEDLTDLDNGEYCVTVTDENNCTQTDCAIVDFVENTINPELDNYITITPNPTSGELNVRLKLPTQSNVRIDFYDVLGRLILNGETYITQEQDLIFDLSSYADGVYLLKLVVDEEMLVKRIVKED